MNQIRQVLGLMVLAVVGLVGLAKDTHADRNRNMPTARRLSPLLLSPQLW